VTKIGEPGTTQVAASDVPGSPIFVTLMKEAPGSSETSVLTRSTRRNNQENTILHSHRRESLKSYAVSMLFMHSKKKAPSKYRLGKQLQLLKIVVTLLSASKILLE
jgi:hypothetical protein